MYTRIDFYLDCVCVRESEMSSTSFLPSFLSLSLSHSGPLSLLSEARRQQTTFPVASLVSTDQCHALCVCVYE